MRTFYLFIHRDFKQLFANPRCVILPAIFFGMSLFLFNYVQRASALMATASPSSPWGMYLVVFFLSTSSALGTILGKDHQRHFLQVLLVEKRFVLPYLLSKWGVVSGVWTLLFSGVCILLEALAGRLTPVLILEIPLVFMMLSSALGALYSLFDALCFPLKGSHSLALLSLLVFVPFVLPLILLALLGLEKGAGTGLLPLMGYSLFLTLGALMITKKILRS